MAYEYYNGNEYPLNCIIGADFKTVTVPPGTYVPTPEQEAEGLVAGVFVDYVKKKWLSRTKPATRRSLLQEAGLTVPEDLLRRTAHLPEFQGLEAQSSPVASEPDEERAVEEDASEQVFEFDNTVDTSLVDTLALATSGDPAAVEELTQTREIVQEVSESGPPQIESVAEIAEPETPVEIKPQGELVTVEDVDAVRIELDETDQTDDPDLGDKIAVVQDAACSSKKRRRRRRSKAGS